MTPETRLTRFATLSAAVLLLAVSGCRSAFVRATVQNQSGDDLKLVEVDYPSASFGLQQLKAGSEYHYRFKLQGSGEVKIQFVDAAGKLQTSTGPTVSEGQEGTLQIVIAPNKSVSWTPQLRKGS